MAEDRKWMYDGWSKTGRHSDEWVVKTKEFVDRAFSFSRTGMASCPCRLHGNNNFFDYERLSLDLCQFGFMPRYEV